MTDLRTAAQQALEALELVTDLTNHDDEIYDAITALRAALAEPVQERAICDECGKHKRDGWALYCVGCMEPVFAPPQRKPPATIDEMFDRMDKAPKGVFFGHDPMTIWMEAWRAAEQQHGIT